MPRGGLKNVSKSAASQPRMLQVKVKPNAWASTLEQTRPGVWLAQIKAPPVDGRANDELVALRAAHFGVRRSMVTIRSGGSGRLKRILIDVD